MRTAPSPCTSPKTIEAWLKELEGFFLRRLGPNQPIDDLVQEASLRLCRALAANSILGDPRAYLFQVGRNLAVDIVRQNLPYSMGFAVQDMVVCESPICEVDPELVVDGEPVWVSDLLGMLPLAMRQLPPTQRQAVEMHYNGGLTCVEIAAEIGVSHDAARVRLCRGRRTLERELKVLVSRHRSNEYVKRGERCI